MKRNIGIKSGLHSGISPPLLKTVRFMSEFINSSLAIRGKNSELYDQVQSELATDDNKLYLLFELFSICFYYLFGIIMNNDGNTSAP